MRLANPIYDAAFKYLLEDTDIAKGLIGRIIGEEIVELFLKPQEILVKSAKYVVIILRIDFKATIKTKEGIFKKVLIEIQKGKEDDDIIRFRRYLASNYRKEDEIKNEKGEIENHSLPIIPIYFLGFRLKKIKTPVVKASRTYEDLVTNEILEEKDDFIEKLTHDGYFIQIPRIEQEERNKLEKILKIFNQSYRLSDDNRLIEISESELNEDPLLKKMGNRLLRAAADEEILAKMEIEEEVEERIEKQLRKSAALEEVIEVKQKEIEGQQKAIEEKEKTLQEKLKVLQEKDEALQEKDEALQEKDEALQNRINQSIEQLLLYTKLDNEQIAQMQGVSVKRVNDMRKKIDFGKNN